MAAQEQAGTKSKRRREHDNGQPDRDGSITARQAADQAAEYLSEMIGQPPELVIAVEPYEQGWLVQVEVLELARVPDSTDVLATYEVELDAQGEPRSYRRVRRYQRSRVGED